MGCVECLLEGLEFLIDRCLCVFCLFVFVGELGLDRFGCCWVLF